MILPKADQPDRPCNFIQKINQVSQTMKNITCLCFCTHSIPWQRVNYQKNWGKNQTNDQKKKKKKPPLPHLLFHCINNKKTPNQTQEVWFQEKFQEKTDKKCYLLFLTFFSTSTANFCRLLGYMVTQPWPSCVKLGYLELKDVIRSKYYLIRSGISASTLQSVAAPHHTPFPFQSKSGSKPHAL